MRKTTSVTVDQEGRDLGKTFLLTEMPAAAAEKWALRMFVALKGSGDGNAIAESVVRLGMVGVALQGLNVFLRADIDPKVLEPLLDEMLTCIKIIRDPQRPDVVTAMRADIDIEEVPTLLWLRSEVIRLHTNFSPAEALFTLMSLATQPASSTTSTSPLQ